MLFIVVCACIQCDVLLQTLYGGILKSMTEMTVEGELKNYVKEWSASLLWHSTN